MSRRLRRPDRPVAPSREDREAGFAALDRFVAAHDDDALAWTLAPLLRAYYKDRALLAQVLAPLDRLRVQRRVVAHARTALASPTTAEFVLADDALFAMDTSRHRWVLEPLLRRPPSGREPAPMAPRRLPLSGLRGETRRGIELAEALADALRAGDVLAPMPLNSLYAAFLRAQRQIDAVDRMLGEVRPSVIVIATNHNVPSRALTVAARRHGIPSVYLPHAPLIRDERFSDVPADFAGMRGEAEVDRLVELGVARDRLEVAGDPSLEALAEPEIAPDAAVAFALPSVLTDAEVRTMVEWVRAAAGDDVVVSPHPRQGEAYARRFVPDGWEVWTDRTVNLLRQGPPVVIQQSSGVAVESMLLGLPTLQIDLPGHPPNYPALDPDHVRFVSSAEETAAAITEARASAADPEHRRAIVAWARRWSAHQGDDAVDRAWRVIHRAVAEGAGPAWLNDAWGRV